jgi:plasmid stabilization system protein ParE
MKLVWSEPALADLESIRDYIRREPRNLCSYPSPQIPS